jgi:hypothetical protein
MRTFFILLGSRTHGFGAGGCFNLYSCELLSTFCVTNEMVVFFSNVDQVCVRIIFSPAYCQDFVICGTVVVYGVRKSIYISINIIR